MMPAPKCVYTVVLMCMNQFKIGSIQDVMLCALRFQTLYAFACSQTLLFSLGDLGLNNCPHYFTKEYNNISYSLLLVGLDISSSFTPRYSGPAYQSYRQVLQSQQSALQQQKATNPRGVNPRISHSLQHPPTATPDSGNVLITVIRQYQYILFCLLSLQGGLLGTYCKDGNILVCSHFPWVFCSSVQGYVVQFFEIWVILFEDETNDAQMLPQLENMFVILISGNTIYIPSKNGPELI